jgi:MFS family permease
MNAVTFEAYVLTALLTAALIGSMYLAGRIAERRGRSFKNWASVAGAIGPLALPVLLLLPNLHDKSPRAGNGVRQG